MLTWVKHRVLDWAHPLPTRVEVFPGDGLDRAIVVRVMREVGVTCVVRNCDDLVCPAAWVDGEQVATGVFSVSRYLGRLGRLYPTSPLGAASVDTALEQLYHLVLGEDDLAAAVQAHVLALENRFDSPDVWMENLDSFSLADACWAGALAWAQTEVGDDLVSADDTPYVAAWWDRVKLPTTADAATGRDEL